MQTPPSNLSDEEDAFPRVPALLGRPLVLGNVAISSRFFLAPLAGYTSLAYRLAVRDLGGLGLATTDLVNARSLLENRPKALDLSATCPADRPMSIQIFGSVVDEMRQAARKAVDLGATLIDINMGCPVRKVVRNGGGSALMCDTVGATRLVASVVEAVEVPVTVKMRLGWDHEHHSAPQLSQAFESVGVAAVIIHGRTRSQGFKGTVDLDGIRRVVEAVDHMPVVGNGDVRTITDAERMFRVTGCAAVSIGRERSETRSCSASSPPGQRADTPALSQRSRSGSMSLNATSAAWWSCEGPTWQASRFARS